jgi:uncharacterized protein
VKLLVVIDTNIWIRILLRGRITLPILEAFNQDKYQLIMSQALLDELHEVWNRQRQIYRLKSSHTPRATIKKSCNLD